MTKKLLVADDSVTIQRVIALTFAGEDVQIEAAADGDRALAMVRDGKHDVVLADVMMPGLSGYEVCARIKEDPELRHIPVVLLVGTFEPFDRAEASRVGSDGHLTKPFDTSELIQTYRALVDRDKPQAPPDGSLQIDSSRLGSAIAGDILVSARTRDSFLGEDRILDILPRELTKRMSNRSAAPSGPRDRTPPDAIRSIIEGVVRQISPEIVREVAWEVVPEMSEMMIRKSLDEAKAGEH